MGLVERGAMDLGAMVFEVLGTVPERAVRVLDALSRQQPADSGAWFFRGRAQALAGRFEDAVQSYERTLEIAPGDSSTLAHRADARGRAGDHEGLIEDLILVLRSGSSDAAWAERRLLSIAPWQAEQGEWEQLARVSSELVEQAGSVAAYGNLALSLRWLDQIEASEETYRDALDRFPNEASLINDYGLMLEGVGRLEEAAQCFGQAADLGSLDGLENLGILRLRQADVSGARAAFHTVLQQEPERLRSLAGYADVMLRSISSSR